MWIVAEFNDLPRRACASSLGNSRRWDRGFVTRVPMDKRKEQTSKVYFFLRSWVCELQTRVPSDSVKKPARLIQPNTRLRLCHQALF